MAKAERTVTTVTKTIQVEEPDGGVILTLDKDEAALVFELLASVDQGGGGLADAYDIVNRVYGAFVDAGLAEPMEDVYFTGNISVA